MIFASESFSVLRKICFANQDIDVCHDFEKHISLFWYINFVSVCRIFVDWEIKRKHLILPTKLHRTPFISVEGASWAHLVFRSYSIGRTVLMLAIVCVDDVGACVCTTCANDRRQLLTFWTDGAKEKTFKRQDIFVCLNRFLFFFYECTISFPIISGLKLFASIDLVPWIFDQLEFFVYVAIWCVCSIEAEFIVQVIRFLLFILFRFQRFIWFWKLLFPIAFSQL